MFSYLLSIHESDIFLPSLLVTLQSIEPRQLGPYGGGYYTARNETVKLEPIVLKKLQLGINRNKVVLGKVVCSVHDDDDVPL